MARKDHVNGTLRLIWILIPTITVLVSSFRTETVEASSVNSSSRFIRSPISSPGPATTVGESRSSTTEGHVKRHGGHMGRQTYERKVYGLSVQNSNANKPAVVEDHGRHKILENSHVIILIFGNFGSLLSEETLLLRFTRISDIDAGSCNDQHSTSEHLVTKLGPTVGEVRMTLPSKTDLPIGYICLRVSKPNQTTNNQPEFQGSDDWLSIELEASLLPLWLQILCIMFLLLLSGLFSGLNLGLMSLNKTDLKIIINTGTVEEKKFASKIAPVRNHGNFLLCCLLFSNVLVNTTMTILIDNITTGFIAVVSSTMAIVCFGEIVPQAICSRHGLQAGAKTIYITKFFMLITFPLAYPMSKILDKILGEEIGSVYTRERLKELLKVTKDHHGLENEEVGIISGALDMKTKTVRDVMTKLDCVFMLPSDAVLNFDTMAEIEYHGYSRIPIYERERSNIVALLNVKQLTLLDASDHIPLRTVIEFYQNQLFYVFENTRLDYMFRAFREGNRGHMAFVQRVNDDGPGDPYYETIGIVTMEDVLEELLQAEIMDESDVGKVQARKPNSQRPKDAPYMLHKKLKSAVQIPPSLGLAAVQFLSASVEPFKKDHISVGIIQRLMKTTVVFVKAPKLKHNEKSPQFTYLYEKGKPSQYFTMILEGRVQVLVGSEKMTFEGGPFTCFGTDFLMSDQGYDVLKSLDPEHPEGALLPEKKVVEYIPDYTVKALTDVTYFRLKYTAYKAAKLASELERNYKDPGNAAANSNWEAEIEKVLIEVEEE